MWFVLQVPRTVSRLSLAQISQSFGPATRFATVRGLKRWAEPPRFSAIELPTAARRLINLEKVPQYGNIRAMKMQKDLAVIRGEYGVLGVQHAGFFLPQCFVPAYEGVNVHGGI